MSPPITPNLPIGPSFLLFTLALCLLCLCPTSNSAANSSTNPRGCFPKKPFTPHIVPNIEHADLRVLVPNITSLRQFVNCSDPARPSGFCIDVFETALSILPGNLSCMNISYTCFNFPSALNVSGPTYDDMVEAVANGSYDAVVGDVTITTHRLSNVAFTQPYMESGVVILVKVTTEISPWLLFGSPFSWQMWCTIAGAFIYAGLLLCLLDYKTHPEFFEGHIVHCIDKIFWFVIEALVLLQRESIKSTLARLVMVAWVCFVLLLSASYTAGLSSFLTANGLSTSVKDIASLKALNQRIGYRRGSTVKDYLVTRFQLPQDKLVPLRRTTEFIGNLTNGPDKNGVVAVVDELPYATLILSSLSDSSYDFAMSTSPLTSEGFGLGFNKKWNGISYNFSIAILNLTESGCLDELRRQDHMDGSSSSTSNQVGFQSILALFIPFLSTLAICTCMYLLTRCSQPKKKQELLEDDSIIYLHKDLNHRHPTKDLDLHTYS